MLIDDHYLLGAATKMAGIFKSFVSEKEIEEVKQKRQEEWEKVRRPDQPLRECVVYKTQVLHNLRYTYGTNSVNKTNEKCV